MLQHFHDHPSFRALDGTPIGDSHGGGSAEIRIRTEMLSIEQLAQIWNAFNEPLRLSLVLLAEVIAIDSGEMPTRAPRVLDVYGVAGQKERGSP